MEALCRLMDSPFHTLHAAADSALSRCVIGLAVLLISLLPVCGQENIQTNGHGVAIQLGQAQVELAPATDHAIRLSVVSGNERAPAPSCFLAPAALTNSPDWQPVRDGKWAGLRTAAGEVLVNPHNGQWTLKNAEGRSLIPPVNADNFRFVKVGSDPFVQITFAGATNQPFTVYGCGNGNPSLRQTHAATHVANGVAVIPYYWSPAGYAVLAVSGNDNLPARWQASQNGGTVTWTFPGDTADLYLMPAANLRAAAGAYAQLTGHAPVPPRWTFGYLQSRWGWTNRAYIAATLKNFRARKIPVDAFIFDFEWYTTKPDYEVPPTGVPGFSDFDWNTNLFPDPVEQLRAYRREGVHFVGIRKPRVGNSETLAMIRAKGWELHGPADARQENYQSRDVDFASPNFRAWYVRQTTNLLAQGVAGWWNDEGEGTYTTYYYWNLAEAEALAQVNPAGRLWTLNRAFSPGLQRLGAAAWTGDIRSTWAVLQATPTSLLNWSLAGMPYETCDIGGYDGAEPSPEMLSRWMEAGVFFSVMRSHSALSRIPRFPWLFGPAAEKAIRQAIDLRYRLIPYYYSLAHETFTTGIPLMRPLVMEFPDDPRVADLSDEWLMGASLLAAPVLAPGGKRSVYLPAGTWYALGTNQAFPGGQTLNVTAGLDDIPAYVRAGSILPLGPVIQSTSQLPGGPLTVQIYPGQNAAFTLVEDDGATTGYRHGLIRRTTFKWDGAARRLSWERTGSYAGKDVFTQMRVVLFDRVGRIEAQCALTPSGAVVMRQAAGGRPAK